jgi:2-amino-4-hydroxy-6-hydroxymethyldihydropteridine diphosphokinase
MVQAFISVGSNVEPHHNLPKALRLLAAAQRVMAISTVCQTEPIGRPGQPPFLNCVVKLDTDTPAQELKHAVLRAIEEKLGRRRTEDKDAPRTVDLDLVLYGDLVVETDLLVLPAPEILTRPFLAAGLHEVAPDLRLPGTGVAIAQVAASLPCVDCQPLPEFTDLLRNQILGPQRSCPPER